MPIFQTFPLPGAGTNPSGWSPSGLDSGAYRPAMGQRGSLGEYGIHVPDHRTERAGDVIACALCQPALTVVTVDRYTEVLTFVPITAASVVSRNIHKCNRRFPDRIHIPPGTVDGHDPLCY